MDHVDKAYFEDVTNSIRSAVFGLLSEERAKLRRDHAVIVATQSRSNPNVCAQVNCKYKGILLVPTNAFCHPALRNSPLFNCGRNRRAPRDDEGRVFIDFAPEVVRYLMSFIATLHDDEEAAEPPSIPEAIQKDWIDLLTMFKLTPKFFEKKSRRDWRSGSCVKDVRKHWRRVRRSDQETASSAHSGNSGDHFPPRSSRLSSNPEGTARPRDDGDAHPARSSLSHRPVPGERHAPERLREEHAVRRSSNGAPPPRSPRDGHTLSDDGSGAEKEKRVMERVANGAARQAARTLEGEERNRGESRSSSGQRGSSGGSRRYSGGCEQPSVNFEDVCRGKVNVRRCSNRIRGVVASPGAPHVSKLK
eukprot:GEMP01044179.1.p1 GENE.GEMP01044179.1~~GEMP01044179.1.p1  ORF type:complete len:362 (+),score=106.14 GEMP01044179.1:64-1149(+)